MNAYPKPPFPKQAQPVPGSQKKMDPYPDCANKATRVQADWTARSP